MTATEWLTIMVTVAVAEGLWLVGEGIYRQVVQWRTHHRVPHYKLRAASARGKIAARIAASRTVPIARPELRTAGRLQGDVPSAARRGSAATTTSVEPQPAPARRETSPGAGINLQAGDSRLDRDSVALSRRDESQPAPRNTSQPSLLGAGPHTRIAVDAPDFGGGPGPQQPVGGRDPRLQPPAGVEPGGEPGMAGAARHKQAAPATRSTA